MRLILNDLELKTAVQNYLNTKGLEVLDIEKDISIPYTFFTANSYPIAICNGVVKKEIK